MRKILLVIGILSFSCFAYAQENEFNVEIEENKSKKSTGGFGADLAKGKSFVNFNGYITNELFIPESGTSYFDNHYFNIFIYSQITDKLFVEGQLEYEHAGKEIGLRYGYADYKFSEAFVVRSGLFLVPAGQFNEYLYPEYLSKTVNRAYVNREISPAAWAEVGVQIRGRINTDTEITPFYTLYVVNGLQGDSGNGIRGLRGNDRDDNDNKAIGGSLGFDMGNWLTFSINAYNGIYTVDNELGLGIYGASLYLNKSGFNLWSEFHLANQEAYEYDFTDPNDPVITGRDNLNKSGFYVLASYEIGKIEPVIRYDEIALDGAPEKDRSRITLGVNYNISKTAVLKANYEIISDKGADADDNVFGLQFSLGF